MNDSKAWYLSKTMWAGIVAMFIGIAKMSGVEFGDGSEEQMTDSILAIATGIAGVVAIWGRLTAKKEINGPGKKSYLFFLFLPLLFVGCTQISATPDYKQNIMSLQKNVAVLNERCQEGDDQACREGLALSDQALEYIVDGMNKQRSE